MSGLPAAVRVRFAAPDDLPVIAGLIRRLAEYERLRDEVEMDEERLGRHLFGEPRYAEVLIAEAGGDAAAPGAAGEALGFALFYHTYSTFLGRPGIYLEDLFVDSGARGGGVGRALLWRLAALALERGCGRLEWAVLDWNEPAIGFYRRLGARPNAGWTVYRLAGKDLGRLAASARA